MMIFIIILISLIFVLNAIMPPPETAYKGKPKKTWCPPHKWIYGQDGFLICEECRNKPGYTPRE